MGERSFYENFVRLLAKTVAESKPPEIGKMKSKDAVRLAATRGWWIDAHRRFQEHDARQRAKSGDGV